MSIDRIRVQLGKLGLAGPEDEMSVQVMEIGPYVFFGDNGGDNQLIVDRDYAGRSLNAIVYVNGRVSKEDFWQGTWLGELMRYKGLDRLWSGMPCEALNVSVAQPRSSETVGIGRAKRICRDWWLFESESGEYALVPAKNTVKWIWD